MAEAAEHDSPRGARADVDRAAAEAPGRRRPAALRLSGRALRADRRADVPADRRPARLRPPRAGPAGGRLVARADARGTWRLAGLDARRPHGQAQPAGADRHVRTRVLSGDPAAR